MDKPTKVHIEITADGYTTTVLAGDVEDCHDTAFRAAVTLRALRGES